MPDSETDNVAPMVLIVDDDRMQGRLIGDVCSRIGYRSVFAPSYDVAAELISSTPFSYVTIDLALGDRDGIELLRLIAQLQVRPRVIVISGCEQRILNAAVRLAHSTGVCDAVALPKPIELAALRKALTTAPCDCSTLRRPVREPAVITAADLDHAVSHGEIYAAFQPKIELATGKVIGCEALARWDSATLGPVGPDLFIALAERTGAIKELTLQILRSALRLAGEIGRDDATFVVAVNLSATLLSDPTISEDIGRLLREAGVPARSLMIEITETTAMGDVSLAMDTLLRLRIKGIGISMDDFGTGYSSMSVLAQMPFCELKIDRSFVSHCLADPDLWKVVASSVAIARAYNMTTVAEGIEDVATWQALAALGCDGGQGYVFSPALRHDGFRAWRNAWNAELRVKGPPASQTLRKA
ncbi:EAL domain-containing protein (putative c-di-GMP-specific phosphodiesterase class I) [Rhodopseudomonas rhenobacensis]|uniref:EAL domain-containing protein (Putative c-di-GMP-specific phosphodiesterase class I) n=1 Tax=Rhodopseudomonas rhenobacensis TaxID=87461 RepID=A0A7W7Z3B4_9BRAD|nr:EAL domain-containing response regulator [Rhodopseudomonas rhenobacensis]MBB5047260.1 EAL domain-containing protein (putative c-di-GMP-specific phosphodiesterase class I) [Rhodopseudomonas rhenobacensis]